MIRDASSCCATTPAGTSQQLLVRIISRTKYFYSGVAVIPGEMGVKAGWGLVAF